MRRSGAIGLAGGLAVAATTGALPAPAIPQDPVYHRLADARRWLGVRNALNGLSDAGFVLVGVRLAWDRLPLATGVVSGHTPKHLLAAPAGYSGLRMLRRRHTVGDEDIMMDVQTKGKALGRLRRIEGQVQGIQRMVEEDKYCVDILLQLTAVQGAVEQVQKLLLGQHLETCVADAVRSGSSRDRQRKLDELLEVFSRFSGR